jgi:4-amino-4-deoxy-L-arabinose transferase-like glycosyltransferase
VTSRDTRRDALVVAALVAVALVLRAVATGQSLYGDELSTHDDVVGRSFGSMLDRVRQVEDTPPLFFVVAWASAKLGGAEGLGLRLPSLIAAGATVPLLYAIGRRALGREAALLGAALFAVSPFAVFYGSEARAYSLMAFLAVLSTYCILRAADGDGRGWWIGFAAAAAASTYTHYTAAAVVAADVGWVLVFRPHARRAAVIAGAAAALALAPWLASGPNASAPGVSALFPFTAKDVAKTLAKVASGHPFLPLHELPGTVGVVLLAAAALAVAAGVLLERPRSRSRAAPGSYSPRRWPRRSSWPPTAR